jgi:hypothetical protein
MNKFLSISCGAMVLLAVSVAGAANPDPSRSAPVPPQPTPNPTMQPVPDGTVPNDTVPNDTVPNDNGAVTDGAQSGAEMTAKDRVYLGALKRCEPLQGNERQTCIEAARKKAGQM